MSMCEFMSAIIFKNRTVLAPMWNQSHSSMLTRMGVEDETTNVNCKFVRAELLPYNGDLTSDVSNWRFKVDQDIVPDWFTLDREKYEEEMRDLTKDWVKNNIFVICGQPCTKLKEENGNTYYHTCNSIYFTEFGNTPDYRYSKLRENLLNHEFARQLVEKYGDGVVPVDIDLTSFDGLKDYGKVSGDVLGIPNIDLYRECREHFFVGSKSWWLSTPDSTPSGIGSSGVLYVRGVGRVRWCDCYCYSGGVRPFFILKSSISVSLD